MQALLGSALALAEDAPLLLLLAPAPPAAVKDAADDDDADPSSTAATGTGTPLAASPRLNFARCAQAGHFTFPCSIAAQMRPVPPIRSATAPSRMPLMPSTTRARVPARTSAAVSIWERVSARRPLQGGRTGWKKGCGRGRGRLAGEEVRNYAWYPFGKVEHSSAEASCVMAAGASVRRFLRVHTAGMRKRTRWHR